MIPSHGLSHVTKGINLLFHFEIAFAMDSLWVAGTNYTDGVWRWVGKTTSPIEPDLWGKGEPLLGGGDEHCAEFPKNRDYKMNSLNCSMNCLYVRTQDRPIYSKMIK